MLEQIKDKRNLEKEILITNETICNNNKFFSFSQGGRGARAFLFVFVEKGNQ
jgi:hypothetical protein